MSTTTLLFKLDYPPEIQTFVAEQLAAGCFDSESELATAAIRYVKEIVERDRKLRTDLKRSIEQADRGEVTSLNIEEVIAELHAEWESASLLICGLARRAAADCAATRISPHF